jgi:hypothetical protein
MSWRGRGRRRIPRCGRGAWQDRRGNNDYETLISHYTYQVENYADTLGKTSPGTYIRERSK